MVTSHSNKLRFVLVAFLLLAASATSVAQYRIQLSTNEGREVTKFIYKGYKITYKAKGEPIRTSRIQEITPTYIITKEDTFELHELDFIAYQKPLSQLMKFGAQCTYYGSFGMLVLAYYAYTRLPTFPQLGSALAITGFVPLVISRRIMKKDDYALFDLHYMWTAEVVRR